MEIFGEEISTGQRNRRKPKTCTSIAAWFYRLGTHSERFSKIQNDFTLYTMVEDYGLPGIGKIADVYSSTLGLPHDISSTIPANHVDMVRFATSGDIGYERFKSAIEIVIEDSISNNVFQRAGNTAFLASSTPGQPSIKYVAYGGQISIGGSLIQGDQMAGQGNVNIAFEPPQPGS